MDAVSFTADDGVRLEGELRVDTPNPSAGAVICHAHPKQGGSKDHPVLWSLRNELAGRHGYATLSFNFRGTMGSSGTYGGGQAELKDAAAAIAFTVERAPGVPLLLAGWSFGASVALRESLSNERPAALALIGLPLRPGDLELPPLPDPMVLRRRSRPILFIAGSEDPYCPAEEITSYAGAAGADVLIIDGTDHSLWRREREMAELVADRIDRALGIVDP